MNWIFIFSVFFVSMVAIWLYYKSHDWGGAFFALIASLAIMVGTYFFLLWVSYEAADKLSIVLGVFFCFFCNKETTKETEEQLEKKQEVDVYV